MKKLSLSLAGLGLALSIGLAPAQASVLDTATTHEASPTALYGTFHDRQTDFVFVKLPQGWVFAGRDERASRHEVFHDAATGFVFVKLSSGWKFLGHALA